MEQWLLNSSFAIIILVITWLAGWPPFSHQRKSKSGVDYSAGEALACGIFLGAALLHMLPESNAVFENAGYHYPAAFLGAGVVFLFLLWLEHLGNHLTEHSADNSSTYAWLSTFVLSIHSILSGAALGSASTLSTAAIIMVAVISHKWAASFALAVKLVQSGQSLRDNLIAFGLFSLSFPFGVLVGQLVGEPESNGLLEAAFNSFAAGTFLYLGTLHGLTRATLINKCCNRRDFNFVIVGFLIMAAVATTHAH